MTAEEHANQIICAHVLPESIRDSLVAHIQAYGTQCAAQEREKAQDVANTMLRTAQIIRIQQVQAASAADWEPYRETANQAWHELNQACKSLFDD